MKKILLFFFISSQVSFAQPIIHLLPDSNASWLCSIETSQGVSGHIAYFFPYHKEDTIIKNKNYFKTYKSVDFNEPEYLSAYRNDTTGKGFLVLPGDSVEYKTYDFNLAPDDSIDSLIVFTPVWGDGITQYLIANGVVDANGYFWISTIPNQPMEFENIQYSWEEYFIQFSPFNICCPALQNLYPICISINDTVRYSYHNTFNQDIWVPQTGSANNCMNLNMKINEKNIEPFSLYPNPATNQITIEFQSAAGNKQREIEIYNTMGQLVFPPIAIGAATNPNPDSYRDAIDVSGFSKGLYLFKVRAGEELLVKKVVVE